MRTPQSNFCKEKEFGEILRKNTNSPSNKGETRDDLEAKNVAVEGDREQESGKKVEWETPLDRSAEGLETTWKKRIRTVMSRDGLLWKAGRVPAPLPNFWTVNPTAAWFHYSLLQCRASCTELNQLRQVRQETQRYPSRCLELELPCWSTRAFNCTDLSECSCTAK